MLKNTVTFEGYLIADPVYKYTIKDELYCYFMLSQTCKDRVISIQIICFRENASECQEHDLRMGEFLSIDGRLQTQKRFKDLKHPSPVNIVAEALAFSEDMGCLV